MEAQKTLQKGADNRQSFWFLFARQRKKNPFPSKMEGSGVVESVKPNCKQNPLP
jgi:hypothetical protein